VADGLKKTGDVLARARNRSVLPTLAAALASSCGPMRAAAIRAIVMRNDDSSHRILLQHFDKLHDDERAILRQAHRAMPHHMARALKAAVLGGDAKLGKHACQMIAFCRDYDLFPVLVQAAASNTHAAAADATSSLLQMANLVEMDLATRASEHAAGEHHGRDPTFVRRHLLASLERSLAGSTQPERLELIEAFLLLAPSDNTLLQTILHDPFHPCHKPVTAVLTRCTMPGTVVRLARLLRDTDASEAVLQAIASRTDPEFVHALFAELKPPLSLRVLHNMKRLSTVAWLEEHAPLLLELSGRAQAIAIELAESSGITSDALFRLLALMMEKGLTEARRASCRALAKFQRPEATELIVRALDDPDTGVRAAAIRQLRPRGVPDALKTLVGLLDDRSTEIRDAARASLAEFNFARYRSMFDLLDENAARTTGALVHKVDAATRSGLIEELASPSVTTRMRGIEMAVAMGATQDVCVQLIELSRNENTALRREAVAALGSCHGGGAENAILIALEDAHPSVRDAAAEALARFCARTRDVSSAAAAVGGGTS
jgi:HEAT repeat protein